ncbi:tripartite tricarboxylate transporter substrate binding protein [Salinicola sp. CR57]|uniref:Bug family tripartite tricarboxylate transporter substrate binding protein n=1 Tax=Salinicola sp. CR57 TaxID=1949086 RepID=UPI000DA14375|nr:tripartite tricarboxylate transporter substrate binding protein [Salinicola sp. CR57]
MKTTMLMIAMMAGSAWVSSAQAQDAWPTRPVQMVVIAGAGGGSDYVFRLLSRELEKNTGQAFSVVNQAQGGGVVGMTTYTNAEPDGYTLGQMSPFAQYRVLGQADFTSESFTPIALVNMDPAAVHVAADSNLESLQDIVDALKADPTSLTISCGGTCNASWDIPFVSLMLDEGIDVTQLNLVPAKGAAAGLQELTSGGMDVVLSSLPETDSLREAGLVENVAVFAEQRLDRYPDVPTVEEAVGEPVTGGTWRGVAGPAGMSPALVKIIEAQVKAAFDAEAFQQGMRDRGFGPVWMNADELGDFMAEHEQQTERVLGELRQ